MLVVNPNTDCVVVRSVVIWVDPSNYTEVGMFVDPTGFLDQCPAVSSPRFLAYAQVGAISKCKQNPPVLAAGSRAKVSVENPDHNNRANYYLGTSSQGYHTIGFNQAGIQSFDERHDSTTSLHANMDGLGFMGASDNWNLWTNQTHAPGAISGWTFCEVSESHYKVVSGSC